MTAAGRDDGTTGAGGHLLIPAGGDTAPPAVRRRAGHLGLRLAAGWLVLITSMAVLVPWLPFVDDPEAFNLDAGVRSGPSLENWFGTDVIARDVFSRVIWGARDSLLIGFVATAVGMTVGGLLGLVAGFFRGWVDGLISALANILFAIPALVFVLFVAATREGGQTRASLIFALSILAIPPLTRIVRASSLQWSEREFVQAARVIGARNGRILFKTVLPNVVPALISFAFLVMGITIVVEAGIAAVGGSIDAPTWGQIINSGRATKELEEAPHIALAPSTVLFLTVLSLNWIGDSLVKRFDIREGLL